MIDTGHLRGGGVHGRGHDHGDAARCCCGPCAGRAPRHNCDAALTGRGASPIRSSTSAGSAMRRRWPRRLTCSGSRPGACCSRPSSSSLFSVPAFAQGKISGKVVDAAGGVLPGAAVTVTEQKTGAVKTAVTGADGSFTVDVPPGIYTVTVDLLGFRKGVTRDLTVAAEAAASTEFTLQPRLSEEITVTAMLREETCRTCPSPSPRPPKRCCGRGVDHLEGVAATCAASPSRTSAPARARSPCAASRRPDRPRPAGRQGAGRRRPRRRRSSRCRSSRRTSTSSTCRASRCCAARRARSSAPARPRARCATSPTSPRSGSARWFDEVGLNTMTDGEPAATPRLAVNAPLGDQAALRVAAYWNGFGGFIDAVTPDLSIDEDVNSGDRAGGRAALRFRPDDKLTITPRVVYQKEEDGRLEPGGRLQHPRPTPTRRPVRR